jgi:hypothetical protein
VDFLTSIRLPAAVLDRADVLVAILNRKPSLTALGPVTRSAVLRLAMIEGLDVLERRHKRGGAR